MHTYIGTKLIKAIPMTRGEYNAYRGWALPDNENGSDEGYLVEYPDSASNHDNHDGYISWSPKKQFEAAYIDLGHIEGLPAYQQRVIGEYAELKKKCDALQNWIGSVPFSNLLGEEQIRLRNQYQHMGRYLATLNQRIEAFRE